MAFHSRETNAKITMTINVLDKARAAAPGTWLHVNGSEFVSQAGCVIPVVGAAGHPALGVVVKCHRPDPVSGFTRVLLQTRGEVLLAPGETPEGWSKKVLDAHYVLVDTAPAVDRAPNRDPTDLPPPAVSTNETSYLQLATIRRWPMRFG